jgi:hypothetical protein
VSEHAFYRLDWTPASTIANQSIPRGSFEPKDHTVCLCKHENVPCNPKSYLDGYTPDVHVYVVWDASNCVQHGDKPVDSWRILPMGRVPDPFGTRADDEVWAAEWEWMVAQAWRENKRYDDEVWAERSRKRQIELDQRCQEKTGGKHDWYIDIEDASVRLIFCIECKREHPFWQEHYKDDVAAFNGMVRVDLKERREDGDVWLDIS